MSLGIWLNNQRARRDKLTGERPGQLEALGVGWQGAASLWKAVTLWVAAFGVAGGFIGRRRRFPPDAGFSAPRIRQELFLLVCAVGCLGRGTELDRSVPTQRAGRHVEKPVDDGSGLNAISK